MSRELVFFTLNVEGRDYGGWYRLTAPCEIEVIAHGYIVKTSCADDPLIVARSVLERTVRDSEEKCARG